LHIFDGNDPGMTVEEFELPIAGTLVRGKVFVPEQVRAIVVIVHGMGEHALRYARTVIPALLEHHCCVYAYDQFGHGQTKGKRGHHPGFEHLLDCVEQVISSARERWPEKMLFLYGHSMGGNIVLRYGLNRKQLPDACVVTSPFLRLAFAPPAWKLIFGRLLLHIFPSWTMSSGLDTKALSRDEKEVEAYEEDTLVHDRVSAAYSLQMMDSGKWILESAGSWNLPLLLCHGTADRITDPGASAEFAEKAGNYVDLLVMEGGYHELHHDLDRAKLLDQITRWMDLQIQVKTK